MNPVMTREPVEMLKMMLPGIVQNPEIHGKWLNSLAFMEHVGATKIARTQSGEKATFTTLKHASEEARHGFYLKKLAMKVFPDIPTDFRREGMLAPIESRQYLYRLDTGVSRMLQDEGITGREMRDLAYLLVTYAIEMRADSLYPEYQACIENYPVKISVRTIINEEEGHLEEMLDALSKFDRKTEPLMEKAVNLESALFAQWVQAIHKTLPESV